MNKKTSFAFLPLAALVVLAACSKSGDAPATSENPDIRASVQADVRRIREEGPEYVGRQLRPLDYWLHYKMMQATGIEAELGGEERTIAALKAMGAAYEHQMRVFEAEIPRLVPVAFTGEGMDAGFLGMGFGTAVGAMTGALFTGPANSLSDEDLAQFAAAGPVKYAHKDGSAAFQTGADGSLDQLLEFAVNESGVSGKTKVKIKIEACPDADGKLTITMDTDSSMHVSGKAGTGGYVRSQLRYERYLDDDAHLIDDDTGSASEMHIGIGGFENYEGQHMDVTLGVERGRKGFATRHGDSGFNILFRPEEYTHANTLIAQAFRFQQAMAEFMLRGAGTKGGPWESGRCVNLKPTTTPAKRKGAKPSTQFEIVAEPRAASDGAPTGGTVKATLSGGNRLSQDGVKVPADARYTYTAPEKRDESASIAFEARSKRGVGKATLEFDTKRKQGYHFSCGGHDPIEQDVCGIDRPFVLNGKLFGHELSGGQSGTTKIVRHPQVPGVKWNGSGTYVMSFPDGEDQPGTMTVNAGGTTATVQASAHTTGGEQCVLTPLEDCE
ncbi:MAG: hypothetical protein QM612_11385 [Thermomonas sp.]|uniref:hypothetical protein n=1 Tax=Thermomonas sp. TaxID=1971895 RepID=UPI0039E71E62